jgi:hypothetical protein
MTDFRARGTIMGPAGLTAVFGMGTGVTPPVSSPETPPAGGQAAPGADAGAMQGNSVGWSRSRVSSARMIGARSLSRTRGPSRPRESLSRGVQGVIFGPTRIGPPAPLGGGADGSGWSSDRLLGLVRCGGRPPYTPSPSTWSSSRSLRTKVLETSS